MPRDFSQVDTWVFDLDNTLYPHHLNLWEQVDERIRDYIANFLKLSHDDAFKLQKDYYRRYGTSMRGMMIGVNSLNVFVSSVISGRIGGLYEQVSAPTFWIIHAAIVAVGGVALLLFGGNLRRLFVEREEEAS